MSAGAPHIDLATPADVDDLARLETELFYTDRCSRRSFRALIAKQRVVVLRDDLGGITGYAILLARSNSKKMRLYSFGIVAASRRQGQAGALLAKLEEMARAAGCHTLTLEVGDGNHAAVAFYAKHGFVQHGFRLHYYEDGGHALLMQKTLTPPTTP